VGSQLHGACIRCEDPNTSLYTFVGNLEWEGETTALDAPQLLLRDSKLRNATFVYGCVVSTGHRHQSDAERLGAPVEAQARIERRMTRSAHLLFAILLTLAVVGSHRLWGDPRGKQPRMVF